MVMTILIDRLVGYAADAGGGGTGRRYIVAALVLCVLTVGDHEHTDGHVLEYWARTSFEPLPERSQS